jgi:hypothetical protein
MMFNKLKMKTILHGRIVITVITMIVLNSNANSQSVIKWSRLYGSIKDDYVMNYVTDTHGNLYISGKTTGVIGKENLGKNDGFLSKTDSSGNIIWSRQFGTSEEDDIQWSAIDGKGNIYITGSTTGNLKRANYGKEDIFVMKYDPSGEILWTNQFGTEGIDVARGIFADHKGFIYLTGNTDGKLGQSAFGKTDCFIMKLDKDGNQLFTTQFGTSEDDYSYSVIGGKETDIFICGATWGDLGGKNKGFIDLFTGEFSESVVPVKFYQLGSEGFDIAEIINLDNENNIYVGGTTSGNFSAQQVGEGDCFLFKMNGKGEILWTDQFGTKNHDGLRSIAFNAKKSDNFLVSGILNLPPGDAFVRMYGKDGKMQWEKIYEGCSGKCVSFDGKGNYYHAGLTGTEAFGKLIGLHNYYVVKASLR